MNNDDPLTNILVQPWFSAQGHPAQSLLNFARLIPRSRISFCLVPSFDAEGPFATIAKQLSSIVPVKTFRANDTSLRRNTMRAGFALFGLALSGNASRNRRPVFIDCDIFVFCLLVCTGIFLFWARPAAIILHGPEKSENKFFFGRLLKWIVELRYCTIFLRSLGHLEAWRAYCPSGRFRLLPPVEGVVSDAAIAESKLSTDSVHIGVIGQIRVGKSIPDLLNLADRHPEAITLAIRGPLAKLHMQELTDLLQNRATVRIGYMSETEMMEVVGEQDYLSCLFEEIWDLKSESATFWLAVKASKPVVCFDDGWVADMVRRTGCGIVLPRSLFSNLPAILPRRNSAAYRALLGALQRYRKTLSRELIWAQFDEAMR